MNGVELRLALRTLPFLDARSDLPEGMLDLRQGPHAKLLVWHPDAIDRIFRSDRRLLHPGSNSLMPLFGAGSLLWADGERHAAYRRALGPPLRGKRLTVYEGLISRITHEALDELSAGSLVALPAWSRRIALRVVAAIVLGAANDTVLVPFTRWIDRALGSRRRTLAYRYLRGGLPRSSAELDRSLIRQAKVHRGGLPPTLAAVMLSGEGPLGKVDDEELRDQLVSLLFAGHETTASATAWTLYHLARDRQLTAAVRAEIEAAGDGGADAGRVPLLQAVIQEALRLAPPVTVAENRTLTEDTELLGRTLPAGTTLTPSIYLAHRRRDSFADPRRFDPARFLDTKASPQRYLPFGGGSRHCLGSGLAQLEIRMITAAVLGRLDWECVNPRAAVPELRGHAMAPSAKLRMRVTGCRA
ncbi:cytochrome P450 [Amycolatopsis marina]|uniref:cytochrome P450 n=1 Tax=Amycolatopsis marina TaxID=490629 RepID=UPI000B867476|nr:cytochrome P450 [Amycolatopsis marina]